MHNKIALYIWINTTKLLNAKITYALIILHFDLMSIAQTQGYKTSAIIINLIF